MSDYRRPVDELPVKNEGTLSLTDTLIGVDAVAEPAAFQAQLGEIAARLVGPIADDLPSDAGFMNALIASIIGPSGALPVDNGTWTPVIGGSVANPTVTYTAQEGAWVRVGPIVQLMFSLGTSSLSGGSGSLNITGHPFSTSGAPHSVLANGPVEPSNLTLPGGRTSVSARLGRSGVGTITLVAYGSALSLATIGLSDWSGSAGFIRGSLVFALP